VVDGQPVTADRFTEAGDAALESRIADVLGAAVDRVRAEPGLHAVLLGGSLGRGEGTVEHAPDGDRLASDVELYLVGRSSGLREAARRLEAQMRTDGLGDVSAAWLHPEMLARGRGKNLSWKPSRTIRLYDLAHGSRTLVGTPPVIRGGDAASLPLAEGVRLVLNRLAEAGPDIAIGSAGVGRWIDKILIACGDTLLLGAAAYTVRYRDRLVRLTDLTPPWPMPEGWRDEVTAAYVRKLTGEGGPPPETGSVDELVTGTLRRAVPAVAGTDLEPLHSFVPRYVAGGARNLHLLRYHPPIGPSATYEGLVLLARAARAGHRLPARALAGALLGRPLSLVLQAAALPLFLGIIRREDRLLRVAAAGLQWGGLPPAALTRATDAAALADLLRRHWAVAT
jgi:hypothetical protein